MAETAAPKTASSEFVAAVETQHGRHSPLLAGFLRNRGNSPFDSE